MLWLFAASELAARDRALAKSDRPSASAATSKGSAAGCCSLIFPGSSVTEAEEGEGAGGEKSREEHASLAARRSLALVVAFAAVVAFPAAAAAASVAVAVVAVAGLSTRLHLPFPPSSLTSFAPSRALPGEMGRPPGAPSSPSRWHQALMPLRSLCRSCAGGRKTVSVVAAVGGV